MINVLVVLVSLIFSFGCLKKNKQAPSADLTPMQSQINTLNNKQKQLEALAKALGLRVDALELISVTHSNLLNSLQDQIDSGQTANTNISLSLDFLEDRLQILEAALEDIELSEASTLVEIQTVTNNVTMLTTEISALNAALKRNDLFVDIPQCGHSYFVLYNPDKSINQFWVSENNQTIEGAWILQNNQNYNLVLGGITLCTGVRIDITSKKFYYNNGVSKSIELGY